MAGKQLEATPHHRRVLLAIGLLYVGFGVMAGLLQGGLPPILRARGMSMETIAWTFALYLPIGLSFLWAPLVDRLRLPWLSPRIAWIVLAQAVAVLALIAIALLSDAPLGLLFSVGLVVAVAAATMDLALDALAVELTPAHSKPLAASMKLAALALGGMLGGGVLVAALAQWGWQTTFWLVAAFMLLSLLPILGLVGYERTHAVQQAVQQRMPTQWFACLRQSQMRQYLLVLVVAAGVIFPLSALNRVMLVDIGVPMERIAWLAGTLQPLALLAIAVLTTPLIRWLGHKGALWALSAAGALCVLGLMLGHAQRAQALALVATVGMAAVVGGLMVVYSALILRWSEGPQAATNYAVLFCGTRLAGMVTSVLAGKLVALLAWQTFYGLGLVALLLSSAWLLWILRRSQQVV